LDGAEIGRYDGPDGVIGNQTSTWKDTSMALGEDNDVIVARFGKERAGFVSLDRDKHAWMPVSIAKEHAPTWARMLGFDGTTLVVTTTNGRLSRFNKK
jgi:hypothetical protein